MPLSEPVTATMHAPDLSCDFEEMDTQTDVLALVERHYDSTMPAPRHEDESPDDDGPTLVRLPS